LVLSLGSYSELSKIEFVNKSNSNTLYIFVNVRIGIFFVSYIRTLQKHTMLLEQVQQLNTKYLFQYVSYDFVSFEDFKD